MNTRSPNESFMFEGYLKGKLSEKEEADLADWINLSSDNYQSFKEYVSERQFFQQPLDDTNAAWKRFRSKIIDPGAATRNSGISFRTWLKIAAVIVLAMLSGFFANEFILHNYNDVVFNEVIVPNGEKAQLLLSDGTSVFLNAGSQLKYPAVFSTKNREVALKGEAFFEVTKDQSHPFIINTPKFDVKVMGTSFNLSTYTEDEVNSLSLHSGEVIIIQNGKEYEVHPGEKFALNTQMNKFSIENADVHKSSLWTTGVIVIDNLKLDEIRKNLERRFNIEIRIDDDRYKQIKYSGQFKPYETLEQILNLIKEASPIKFAYEIDESRSQVVIR